MDRGSSKRATNLLLYHILSHRVLLGLSLDSPLQGPKTYLPGRGLICAHRFDSSVHTPQKPHVRTQIWLICTHTQSHTYLWGGWVGGVGMVTYLGLAHIQGSPPELPPKHHNHHQNTYHHFLTFRSHHCHHHSWATIIRQHSWETINGRQSSTTNCSYQSLVACPINVQYDQNPSTTCFSGLFVHVTPCCRSRTKTSANLLSIHTACTTSALPSLLRTDPPNATNSSVFVFTSSIQCRHTGLCSKSCGLSMMPTALTFEVALVIIWPRSVANTGKVTMENALPQSIMCG